MTSVSLYVIHILTHSHPFTLFHVYLYIEFKTSQNIGRLFTKSSVCCSSRSRVCSGFAKCQDV